MFLLFFLIFHFSHFSQPFPTISLLFWTSLWGGPGWAEIPAKSSDHLALHVSGAFPGLFSTIWPHLRLSGRSGHFLVVYFADARRPHKWTTVIDPKPKFGLHGFWYHFRCLWLSRKPCKFHPRRILMSGRFPAGPRRLPRKSGRIHLYIYIQYI